MRAFLAAFLLSSVVPLFASSYYTSRLDDPRATYLTQGNFSVTGDGIADDSQALQQAINTVQQKTNQGILFIPAGRYRLTKTIYIWPGIRLIGFGQVRPTFVLAANTPGFQQAPAYMLFFAGARPHGNTPPPDANPGTFYSAISNIDIEIQDGNPGAVGIRAHYAQHCFLAHMDFHIGSALAGIRDGGNVAQDVHFYEGQYGIWTRKPSPGWQFTLIDSTFEGQREVAIREHEAGLTLIRPQFKNVPTAVAIDAEYSEELWIKDGRMENITGPAIIISNENSARTEINMENVVCRNVPVFAAFRESGKQIPNPAQIYAVQIFSHGLQYQDIGSVPAIRDVYETATLSELPSPVQSDILDLPPIDTWVNIRTLRAKGDGTTDDTEALRNAVAQHRAIYFPSGQYRVTDTITLKPDTVLIGLHPSVTRILLADSTPGLAALAFQQYRADHRRAPDHGGEQGREGQAHRVGRRRQRGATGEWAASYWSDGARRGRHPASHQGSGSAGSRSGGDLTCYLPEPGKIRYRRLAVVARPRLSQAGEGGTPVRVHPAPELDGEDSKTQLNQ